MDSFLAFWGSEDIVPATATSVFEDFEAKGKDLSVIVDFFNSDLYDSKQFSSSLNVVVGDCHLALKRQLSDFLDGGVFGEELEEDVKKVLGSCPLTNLIGERLFGDLDFDMNKSRNSSLSLRSTKTMWRRNRTAKWME
jgi:hypothetical protein